MVAQRMKSLANFRACSLAPAVCADYKAGRACRRRSAPSLEAKMTGVLMASLDKRGKIPAGAAAEPLAARFAAVRSRFGGREG
jgi:hypothetical protein